MFAGVLAAKLRFSLLHTGTYFVFPYNIIIFIIIFFASFEGERFNKIFKSFIMLKIFQFTVM